MPISPNTSHPDTCPLTTAKATDAYFFEHRAKALDIAAYLDRLDRCSDADTAEEDLRNTWLKQALQILIDDNGDRTRRIHECLSDLTDTPIEQTPGKGAQGCPPTPPHA